MKTILTIIFLSILLQACTQQTNSSSIVENNAQASQSSGLLKSLRPMAGHKDAVKVDKVVSTKLNSVAKSPDSSSDLVAPAAEDVNLVNKDDLPSLDSLNADTNKSNEQNVSDSSRVDSISKQIQTNVESNLIASSKNSGLVPPPPAMTISTPPSGMPSGYPPAYPPPYYPAYPPPNPYYYNPYGQQAPPQQLQQDSHPHGSPFGNVNKSAQSHDDEAVSTHKSHKVFNPINPVGMEPRSPFKQRDDIAILWKGFLNTPVIQNYFNDDKKAANIISQIAVSLPLASTRGNFTVSANMVNQYFKGQNIQDKKLAPYIKKWQTDVVTVYNHYLYTYNKFALSEQTVQARNQEFDVAETDSDKQRAATDLAQAKADLNSAREDMKASQIELAQVVGVNAAKSFVARVSGVTPQLDSYAGLESTASGNISDKKSNNNVFGSIFARHNKSKKNSDTTNSLSQNDDGNTVATTKSNLKTIDNSTVSAEDNNILFKLKNVNITPRKSVLTVAIRNNGNASINISPNDLYVAEGNQKLPEAVVRTDLTKNILSPNSETLATVTIFGRPWNDQLNVVLVKEGKNINLIR